MRCNHCSSEESVREFTFLEVAGALFVSDRPPYRPNDAPFVKQLCNDCWVKWLMWKARLGYDLHTHAATARCTQRCLARSRGRAAQYATLRSLASHPDQMFWIAKTFDGMPNVNGSSQLAGNRVMFFSARWSLRQAFYELLSNVDALIAQLLEKGGLSSLGIADGMLDNYIIVVEAFRDAWAVSSGAVDIPGSGDTSLGLHSVFVTGYADSGDLVRFVNSWGPNGGNHGSGTLSRRYLDRYLHEAWATRRSRWGPTIHKGDLFRAGTSRRRFLQLWQVPNPPRGYKDRSTWQVEEYEALSVEDRVPVECVEVRTGFGLRVGWSFLYHRLDTDGARVSELREIFVWPAFRRLGVGTLMEEWASARSVEWGSSRLSVHMHRADASPTVRAAGRLFGNRRGYVWRWSPREVPSVAAVGVKSPNA